MILGCCRVFTFKIYKTENNERIKCFDEKIDFSSDNFKGFIVKNNNVIFKFKDFGFYIITEKNCRKINKALRKTNINEAKEVFKFIKQIKNRYFESEEALRKEIEKTIKSKQAKTLITETALKHIKGTISIYDLYSLVYTLITKKNETQNIIKDYLMTYHNFLKQLLDSKSLSFIEIQNMFSKKIPLYKFNEKEIPDKIYEYLKNQEFKKEYWGNINKNAYLNKQNNILFRIIDHKNIFENILKRELNDFNEIVEITGLNNDEQKYILDKCKNWIFKKLPEDKPNKEYIFNKDKWEKFITDNKLVLKEGKDDINRLINSNIQNKFIKNLCRELNGKESSLRDELYYDETTNLEHIIKLFTKDEKKIHYLIDKIKDSLGIRDSYINAVYKKDVLEKLNYYKQKYSNPAIFNVKKFYKVETIVKLVAQFGLKPEKDYRDKTILKEAYDKDWYEKICIAVGSEKYDNWEKLIKQNTKDLINLKEIFTITDFEQRYKMVIDNIIFWSEKEYDRIENLKYAGLFKQTAEILGVKPQHIDYEHITNAITNYLCAIAIPANFFKKTFNTTPKDSEKFMPGLIEEKFKKELNIELNPLYKLVNRNSQTKKRDNWNLHQTFMQKKQEDMILMFIAKKYLEELLKYQNSQKGISSFILNTTTLEEIFNKGKIIINKANKQLVFDLKYFNKTLLTLKDKRLDKVLTNYFDNTKTEINYIELNEVLKQISKEQIQIVSDVLTIEKEVLYYKIIEEIRKEAALNATNEETIRLYLDDYLGKSYNQYKSKIENYDKELDNKLQEKANTIIDKYKANQNRILTDDMFKEYCTIFTDVDVNDLNNIRINYRNKAFHNDVPDNGKFEDGIKEIEVYLYKFK